MSGDEVAEEEASECETYEEEDPHGVYHQDQVEDGEQGPEEDDEPDGDAEGEEAESGGGDPREQDVKEAFLAGWRAKRKLAPYQKQRGLSLIHI